MDTPSTWFGSAPGATGGTFLFFFPYAGGNPAAFLPWQAELGPRLQLRVAQLPGRGTRLFEPPVDDMDELVAHLTGAVAGIAGRPFAFFGHSLGALVAFEAARALRRRGLPGPVSLWVSGAEGPQTRVIERRLHELPADELIDALRDYGGTPAELLADREMMGLLLPGLRADFALDERYAYRADAPLDLPIHLLLGDRDPHVDDTRAVTGWARESTLPLREHRCAGDHFFVDSDSAAIAALLRAELGAELGAQLADEPAAQHAGPAEVGR